YIQSCLRDRRSFHTRRSSDLDLSQESTRSQYELFKRYDTFGEAEYRALKERCDAVGIEFMSTPFDHGAAEFLDELVEVHKISSRDRKSTRLNSSHVKISYAVF